MGSIPDFSTRLSPEDFSLGDFSARMQRLEIRVFPLIGVLPMAIEHQIPNCNVYHWQFGLTVCSSISTKSLDSIVVAALRLDFQGESLGTDTGKCACNCLVARGVDN